MQKNIKSITLSALALGLLAAIGGSASADAVAGSSAVARLAGDRDCIRYDYGRATNICSSTSERLVTIAPASLVKSGSTRFWAQGNSWARCQGVAVKYNGWIRASTGYKALESYSNSNGTYLGSVGTVWNDTTIAECLLTGGSAAGSVYSLSFDAI